MPVLLCISWKYCSSEVIVNDKYCENHIFITNANYQKISRVTLELFAIGVS